MFSSSVPAELRAILTARDVQPVSLESIAADIGCRVRWAPSPVGILGMVVIDKLGAVATISERVHETTIETMTIAVLLAETITARDHAWPLPHVRVIAI